MVLRKGNRIFPWAWLILALLVAQVSAQKGGKTIDKVIKNVSKIRQ